MIRRATTCGTCLVHLCAGLTLFGIVARTLRLPRMSEQFEKSAEWIAFAIALIWLVHPLQTQSVTYVIQRCESMMGMFYLLTLYCVLRGSQATRGWPWYAAGIAAIWLGMGCKEVMATAVVVVPLYDRVFLASSWREVFQRRWAFYLGFVPAFAWLFYAISQMSGGSGERRIRLRQDYAPCSTCIPNRLSCSIIFDCRYCPTNSVWTTAGSRWSTGGSSFRQAYSS